MVGSIGGRLLRVPVAAAGAAAAALAGVPAAASAQAAETVNYSYDVRGRLTNVVRTQAQPDQAAQSHTATYAYDAANNRLARSVSGTWSTPPSMPVPSDTPGVVVVPRGGRYVVIPVG